jgi:hypothetical protein
MTKEEIAKKKITDIVVVKDPKVSSRYKDGVKVPITTFIEDYMNGRVDINCDVQMLLQNRTHFFNYRYVGHHLKFLFSQFIPQVTIHSKAQDERVIRDHYDRGNDFFGSFLGDRMIYTVRCNLSRAIAYSISAADGAHSLLILQSTMAPTRQASPSRKQELIMRMHR